VHIELYSVVREGFPLKSIPTHRPVFPGRKTYALPVRGLVALSKPLDEKFEPRSNPLGLEASFRIESRDGQARATVLDSASEEADSGFRAFLTHNPGTASMLYNVEIERDGEPKNEDALREVQQSVIVRIEPE